MKKLMETKYDVTWLYDEELPVREKNKINTLSKMAMSRKKTKQTAHYEVKECGLCRWKIYFIDVTVLIVMLVSQSQIIQQVHIWKSMM